MPLGIPYRPDRFVLLQPRLQGRTVAAHLKGQPQFNRLHRAFLHTACTGPAGRLITNYGLCIFPAITQVSGADAFASRLGQSLAAITNVFIDEDTHEFKGRSTIFISSVFGS